MAKQREGSYTFTKLTVHIVWLTKCRYYVFKGEVQKRCRELIIQICDSEDSRILKGVVSKDHVHMHIEHPLSKSISNIMKRLEGRASRLQQQEYPELQKWPGESISGQLGMELGVQGT